MSTLESRQQAGSGLELVNPSGNKPTDLTNGRKVEYSPWYLRRNGLVSALSQDVIEEFAPEELELFNEVFVRYVEDPTAFEPGSTTESPLAFGAGELAGFVSPVVIAVAIGALQYLPGSRSRRSS